jgi:AcrR family transcriptional regulator
MIDWILAAKTLKRLVARHRPIWLQRYQLRLERVRHNLQTRPPWLSDGKSQWAVIQAELERAGHPDASSAAAAVIVGHDPVADPDLGDRLRAAATSRGDRNIYSAISSACVAVIAESWSRTVEVALKEVPLPPDLCARLASAHLALLDLTRGSRYHEAAIAILSQCPIDAVAAHMRQNEVADIRAVKTLRVIYGVTLKDAHATMKRVGGHG